MWLWRSYILHVANLVVCHLKMQGFLCGQLVHVYRVSVIEGLYKPGSKMFFVSDVTVRFW